MCGIAGLLIKNNYSQEEIRSRISEMMKCLSHRGPDAEGCYFDRNLALGHKRLSIIDTSPASNQPFFSNDDRYVLVYNGEIYNFKELRFELMRAPQGEHPYIFKTESDTEVILAAYIRWGTNCLRYLNGMFAFALYDKQEQSLFIARDRMGEKPLYYVHNSKGFAFSSEIRSLNASQLYSVKLNTDNLIDYLQYQTVFAPNTILEEVQMLEPGHFLIYKNEELKEYKWWNPIQYANPEKTEALTYTEVVSKTRQLLEFSVQKRMVADVPFAAFLSGGIDSSAMVGLMSTLSSNKIDTFHVSFQEKQFSESEQAAWISKKFDTHHHNILITESEFLKDLPNALQKMDHPSGDGINSYLIAKATHKEGIKMAISGLGADELFAGYQLFSQLYKIDKKSILNYTPGLIRKLIAEIYKAKNKSVSKSKIAELLSAPMVNFDYAYPIIRKTLNDSWVRGILKNKTLNLNPVFKIIRSGDYDIIKNKLSKYSILEMQTYMQNVLLRDTDQMSMANSLEVRSPFLDHKLVEFVLGVNDKMKFPTYPKKLLVDALGDLLPKEIYTRQKMGFTLPFEIWMKNELKTMCEDKLNLLSQRDEFNREVIFALWNRFLLGDKEVTWSRMWHLVVLGNWLDENNVG